MSDRAVEIAKPPVDGKVHDLLTVDVWDTLLRRRCHPDSVKLHVCRFLRLRYFQQLPADNRDPWTLLRLRQQAEKDIGDKTRAQGGDDEYRHLDVYRHWLGLAGLEIGQEAEEALLIELDRIEIDQEKYVTYPDPDIAGVLGRHHAKPAVFLSDFYMPASAIRALLAHHEISYLAPDGVVSCDVGVNKRSGRLFTYLHEKLGVPPARHLHVGDNPHADVQAAQSLGVSTVHYLPDEQHRLRRQREAGFHARTDALRQAVQACQEAGAPRADWEVKGHQEAYDHGRRCSLLLVGFIYQVIEQALADGVENLYYFTREGEFFLAIHRALVGNGAFGFPVPDAHLLQVSRLATFAGSLRDLSTSELMRLWNQYSVQSLAALFKSLALEPANFTTAAATHGLEMARPIQYPWQDARVVAFLDDPAVRTEIERELAAKRAALLDYLASAGLDGRPGRVGIVDIGWRGTIQDNLAYALPVNEWFGYYLALNRYLNPQPANVRKAAFGPNLNASEAYQHLLEFVAPLEMLCNSPNGSVIGYERTSQGMRVHRQIDQDENRIYEECAHHFQAGVLDAVAFWADFLRTHAYSAAEIRPLALDIWADIINKPPAFLAQAYFRLNHNETFGVGGFSDKRHKFVATDVLKAFVFRSDRSRLQAYLSEAGWVPGLLVCTNFNKRFRHTLRLYLMIKSIRQYIRRK